MQPMRDCICSSWQFEDTFEISLRKQIIQGKPECDYAFVQAGSLTTSENSHRRKVVQMQPMRLCMCSGRQFEKTFENSLWRKIVKMQPMQLCICSLRRFEKTFENSHWKKSLKCMHDEDKDCLALTNAMVRAT